MLTTEQIAEITQWLQQTDPAPETPYYRDTRRYIQTLLDAYTEQICLSEPGEEASDRANDGS